MARATGEQMARGGILRPKLAAASPDLPWTDRTVTHFEKMLYDNAICCA